MPYCSLLNLAWELPLLCKSFKNKGGRGLKTNVKRLICRSQKKILEKNWTFFEQFICLTRARKQFPHIKCIICWYSWKVLFFIVWRKEGFTILTKSEIFVRITKILLQNSVSVSVKTQKFEQIISKNFKITNRSFV